MEDLVIHMTSERAYAILGLVDDASDEDVKAVYRARALILHPDKGGPADKWLELASAHEYLLAHDKCTRQTEELCKNFKDAIGLYEEIDAANTTIIADLTSRNKELLEENKSLAQNLEESNRRENVSRTDLEELTNENHDEMTFYTKENTKLREKLKGLERKFLLYVAGTEKLDASVAEMTKESAKLKLLVSELGLSED